MCRKIGEPKHVAVQPLPVWFFRGYFVLEFRVIDDPSFTRINQKHLSGLKTSLKHDVFCRNIEDADFRSHDNKAVLRHVVA